MSSKAESAPAPESGATEGRAPSESKVERGFLIIDGGEEDPEPTASAVGGAEPFPTVGSFLNKVRGTLALTSTDLNYVRFDDLMRDVTINRVCSVKKLGLDAKRGTKGNSYLK